jgi:Family of unknown function (DUF5522)
MKAEEERENPKPVEGRDFYREGAFVVFTAAYHLRRGYCCESGCRHCPYGYSAASEVEKGDDEDGE